MVDQNRELKEIAKQWLTIFDAVEKSLSVSDAANGERASEEADARKFVESLPVPHRSGWERGMAGNPVPMNYDAADHKEQHAKQRAAQVKQQAAQVKGRTLAEALATVAKQHQADGKPPIFNLVLE